MAKLSLVITSVPIDNSEFAYVCMCECIHIWRDWLINIDIDWLLRNKRCFVVFLKKKSVILFNEFSSI